MPVPLPSVRGGTNPPLLPSDYPGRGAHDPHPADLRLTPEQFAAVVVANPEAVLELDAKGLARAPELTGGRQRSQLLRQALVALVERESACGPAALGGSEPQLAAIPRPRLEAP